MKRKAGNDPGELDQNQQDDESLLPDQEMELLERQAVIQNALAEIDPRCRDLLGAFFFAEEEVGYEEIAKELGIAVNSLGPIRRRCLDRMRKVLEEMGYQGVRNFHIRSL